MLFLSIRYILRLFIQYMSSICQCCFSIFLKLSTVYNYFWTALQKKDSILKSLSCFDWCLGWTCRPANLLMIIWKIGVCCQSILIHRVYVAEISILASAVALIWFVLCILVCKPRLWFDTLPHILKPWVEPIGLSGSGCVKQLVQSKYRTYGSLILQTLLITTSD